MANRLYKISIVVPSYKQEETIKKDVKRLTHILTTLRMSFEIIVVVDGIFDSTHKRVKSLKDNRVKIIRFKKNYGKGNAVKHGILQAKGDIIGFIDAGMDLDPKELETMLDIMENKKADIVIGSKLHPESRVNYPRIRKLLSWGYRSLTHLLFGFEIKDTQVGMKLFKRKVAQEVFAKILVKRFAFDVEVLAVAYRFGYHRIYESPIHLNFTGISTITSRNFWKIIYWMLWDTAAVFYRLKIIHYYDKK